MIKELKVKIEKPKELTNKKYGQGKHPNSHTPRGGTNQTTFQKGHKPLHFGESHWKWVGDNITYHGVHSWIRKYKPKQDYCNDCKKNKRLYIANISGKYLRDICDYEWLCQSCHLIKDWKRIRKTGVKSTNGRI